MSWVGQGLHRQGEKSYDFMDEGLNERRRKCMDMLRSHHMNDRLPYAFECSNML
jgi:hypothetical protein